MSNDLDLGPNKDLLEAFFDAMEQLAPERLLEQFSEFPPLNTPEKNALHTTALVRAVKSGRMKCWELATRMVYPATITPSIRLAVHIVLSCLDRSGWRADGDVAGAKVEAEELAQSCVRSFVESCVYATEALLVRDLLEADEFAGLYGCFATMTPVDAL